MPHAGALAKGLDLKLCLVRVSRGDNMSESEREGLDLLANQIRSEGVADVECKILYGDPSRAIVDLTYEYPDDLVAMTTHGRSGMSRGAGSSPKRLTNPETQTGNGINKGIQIGCAPLFSTTSILDIGGVRYCTGGLETRPVRNRQFPNHQ